MTLLYWATTTHFCYMACAYRCLIWLQDVEHQDFSVKLAKDLWTREWQCSTLGVVWSQELQEMVNLSLRTYNAMGKSALGSMSCPTASKMRSKLGMYIYIVLLIYYSYIIWFTQLEYINSIFSIVTGMCNHHHSQLSYQLKPRPSPTKKKKKPVSFSSHSTSTHPRQQLLSTSLCRFVYSGHTI